MKKIRYFIVALLFASIVSAQEEFSFQLFFEDAIGHRDTITLGYDPLATDTIDTAFGEVNILNQPWSDSTLDVRIGDKMFSGEPYPLTWSTDNTYQTKRQILSSSCNHPMKQSEVVTIQFRAKNFPIKVQWNNNIQINNCQKFSTFFATHSSALNPPDAFNGLPLFYSGYNFIINWNRDNYNNIKPYFFMNNEIPLHNMEYYIENTDTIGIFKFIFQGDLNQAQLQENLENNNVSIYPNPTNDFVTIDIENNENSELLIYQLDGTLIRKQTLLSNSNNISISDLNAGVYLFKIDSDKGMITKKVIKN